MTDVFDSQKRSWVMSRIKGKDTKPELFVRSLLHQLGYRFTVNGPRNRKLPGKPDLVLPKYRTVLFVHGCFWHGHDGCKHYRIPKSRTAWWRAKIEGNRARDEKNVKQLEMLGWNVVTVWTCEFDTVSKRQSLPEILVARIDDSNHQTEPLKVAEPKALYGKDLKNKSP